MKKFVFHSDAGHGWLAIKRKLLEELNLLSKISGYSYTKGKTVYLEEDCDAPLFIEAYKAKYGVDSFHIKSGAYVSYSPIRSYESYKEV